MDETLKKLENAAPEVAAQAKAQGRSFMDIMRSQNLKRLGFSTKGTANLIEETGSLGGFIVDDEFNHDLIGTLYSKSVVLPRATVYPMKTDNMYIPRISAGASVYWEQTGGATDKTQTDLTFEQLRLQAFSVYGYAEISEQLAEDSDPAAIAVVQQELAGAIMNEFDGAMLEGAGSGVDPIDGVVNQSSIGTADAGAVFTSDDIADGMTSLEASNHSGDGVVAHPSVKGILRKLKDSDGNYIWSDPRAGEPATVFGMPVLTTSAMVATAGSRNVIIGEWKKAAVGLRRDITLKVSEHAAFKGDRIAVRMTARVAFGLKYPSAFYVITSV